MATPRRQLLLAFFMVSVTATSQSSAEEQYTQLLIRFGVPVEIQIFAASRDVAGVALDAAFSEAKRLDRIFSDYDPDSETRRLAASRPNLWLSASPEFIELSRHARKLTSDSQGAFDVTVGPLTHLWRKTMRFEVRPDEELLSRALDRVGNARWDLRDDSVTFLVDDMRLDFGGIAKGYALDRMARELERHDVRSYLIDAGGDILCGDNPPGRSSWLVEIEPPTRRTPTSTGDGGSQDSTAASNPLKLQLTNRAVATSGTTYQSVTLDGKTYSHIVDPRTGYGVQFLSNVTVEADHGWLADALASAVSVMERGHIEPLLRHYPGVVVRIDGEKFEFQE